MTPSQDYSQPLEQFKFTKIKICKEAWVKWQTTETSDLRTVCCTHCVAMQGNIIIAFKCKPSGPYPSLNRFLQHEATNFLPAPPIFPWTFTRCKVKYVLALPPSKRQNRVVKRDQQLNIFLSSLLSCKKIDFPHQRNSSRAVIFLRCRQGFHKQLSLIIVSRVRELSLCCVSAIYKRDVLKQCML